MRKKPLSKISRSLRERAGVATSRRLFRGEEGNSLAHKILLIALSLFAAIASYSQSLTFDTLAGSPPLGSTDGTASAAHFANPWGVAADTAGNLYVADTDNHTVRKISSGGIVSTFAGMPGISGSADGSGTNALFFQPQGVAVDGAGNVYVADTGNYTIRKITPQGVVSTLAGLAGNSGTNDLPGSSARFYEPEGLAVNNAGSLIYVADTWNHTIRQVTSAGAVTTLAGSALNPGSMDGLGTVAQFNQPAGLALDAAGNLYVGDTGNHTIRKVTSAGAVTNLAGLAGAYGTNDGPASLARFWAPQGVAVDSATNLYIADSFNNTIRKLTPAGQVSTFAGAPGYPGADDDTGSAARFWQPQGVAVDTNGNVYVADTGNGTIRKLDPGGAVTTQAGLASRASTDGSGNAARFAWPSAVALDSAGTAYVVDTGNGTVRVVSPSGQVSTLAGSAGNFGSADGTGTNAQFLLPQGLTLGPSGNLYIADTANHTIRKVSANGVVSTWAGLAGNNGLSDGAGSNARFNGPQGLAADASGNVYVADTWNHTVRKVDTNGVVSTLAGVPGYSGDIDGTSPGTGTNSARFNCPSALAIDGSGNIYVADTRNHTLRQISPGGVVSTLAGMAGVWGSVDGTNSGARFNQPKGLVVDSSGNLFVLDSGNHCVRQLTPVGTNWVVTTVAGAATLNGYSDGAGSAAHFSFPGGLAVNSAGAFCVADSGNNTIRAGLASLNAGPAVLVQPQNVTTNSGATVGFSITASGLAPLSYQWLLGGTNLPGATSASYVLTNVQSTNAGSYSVIVSNFAGMVTSSNAMLVLLPPLPGHFDSLSLRNDGSLQLNMSGSPGVSYTLEYSEYFTNWLPLVTVSSSNGVFNFIDPSPATNAARFYRLRFP